MSRDDAMANQFFENGVRAEAAVTIQRPAAELYQVWRDFRQLPRFIDDLERVDLTAPDQTVWTVRLPGGSVYTWEAKVIREQPGKVIAWTTGPEADVANAGSITFRELPYLRGTEVRVVIEYLPPGGSIGDAVAKTFGQNPEARARKALFQFRQLMETGEVAVTVGQPTGANRSRSDDAGESDRKTDPELRDLAGEEKRP